MKHIFRNILAFVVLILIGASCQKTQNTSQTIELATSAENNVQVTITLNKDDSRGVILSATFTPQSTGLHLYSKNIPKTGLDGLGRPTLLELSKDSPMQAVSELMESASPETPSAPPLDLLIYPAGPVTLSYQVLLPEGNKWIDDQVIVTYMACDDTGCRPPIQQKPIAVKIPGKDLFQ